MSTVHELKCNQDFFEDVKSGKKPYEVRFDDREYQEGDFLHLREVFNKGYCEGSYTLDECMVLVTHVLPHEEFPAGVPEGWVVMGIRVLS